MGQQAASLAPAENRAAVTDLGAVLEPDTGLVVLPEAYMRDFGPPDSSLGPVAEPLDGPFVARLTWLATGHGSQVLAGMFEAGDGPARPFNTLVLVDGDGLQASYRKIHLYD